MVYSRLDTTRAACSSFRSILLEGRSSTRLESYSRAAYQRITGISRQALRGNPFFGFGIDTRFAWADGRDTERPEDQAYCLLGIFGVRMTLHYGEGTETAFARLRKKIAKLENTSTTAKEPALLSFAPSQMTRSEYLSIEVKVQQSPKGYSSIEFKEINIEKRYGHKVLHRSGEDIGQLPEDFQKRLSCPKTEVEREVDLDKWRLVYWEERRCSRGIAVTNK